MLFANISPYLGSFDAGAVLATVGGNSVCIWDLLTGGKLLRRLSNFQKTVTCVRLSPLAGPETAAAPRMLCGSLDGHVKVSVCGVAKGHAAYKPCKSLSHFAAIGSLALGDCLDYHVNVSIAYVACSQCCQSGFYRPALPHASSSSSTHSLNTVVLLSTSVFVHWALRHRFLTQPPYPLLLTSQRHHTISALCLLSSMPGLTVLTRYLVTVPICLLVAQVFDLDTFKVTHASRYPGPILSVGLSPDCSLLAVGQADGLLSIRKHRRPKQVPVEQGEYC